MPRSNSLVLIYTFLDDCNCVKYAGQWSIVDYEDEVVNKPWQIILRNGRPMMAYERKYYFHMKLTSSFDYQFHRYHRRAYIFGRLKKGWSYIQAFPRMFPDNSFAFQA